MARKINLKAESHAYPTAFGLNQLRDKSIVLPSQTIREYVSKKIISASEPILEEQIQPASIDLRLGSVAYELRASFLPGVNADVQTRLLELQLCNEQIDLRKPFRLRSGSVYLVELMEVLHLPSSVSGRANPRSTTGRTDMFTRLLCDAATEFDEVHAGYWGKLYAEIVPRTFSVRVKRGTRVNQLRFHLNGENTERNKEGINKTSRPLMYFADGESSEVDVSTGVQLSVDLTPDETTEVIAYRAKRNAPVLDFDSVGRYDPYDYWEPIFLSELHSIVLDPDDFYLLRSKERVHIPPSYAAELTPFDPSFGEFRVHYAGFLDPGFGYGKGNIKGTPVVLEVRARDVAFLIEDGQPIARVYYFRLSESADKVYGSDIGSSYQSQGIKLGKQFRQPRG